MIPTLREIKFAHATAVYETTGTYAATARILGVMESTLWRWSQRKDAAFPDYLTKGYCVSSVRGKAVCLGQPVSLKLIENAHIEAVMHDASMEEAARTLGINVGTLRRRVVGMQEEAFERLLARRAPK